VNAGLIVLWAEAIAWNGAFAASIGLVEDGVPVLEVVHGPALGITYAACGPGTATCRNSRRLAEFLQDYPVQTRKSCGSALKFGVIAAGEPDPRRFSH
jgi:3'-phosphoadenosine 5'-phosphosulfate (PAPS) 3'-phosphatase